jgi:hypothetical protein
LLNFDSLKQKETYLGLLELVKVFDKKKKEFEGEMDSSSTLCLHI